MGKGIHLADMIVGQSRGVVRSALCETIVIGTFRL